MKSYNTYIGDIAREAIIKMWKEVGGWEIFFSLIVGFLSKYLSTLKPRTLQSVLGGNWNISVFAFLITLFLFWVIFFVIVAKEKYYSKERIIEKYNSRDLCLDISHAPNPIYKNGNQHFAAALWIKNEEAVKILDLRAMISYHHFFNNPETDRVGSYGVEDVPLFFIDGKTSAQIIDLRPGDRKTLLISEIRDVFLDNGDKKRAALMASDPVFTSGDFCLESIFQIKIILQGKLDGEYIYKSFFYEDFFYAKPQNDYIIFLNESNKSILKMPDELRRRGLKKIEYLEET